MKMTRRKVKVKMEEMKKTKEKGESEDGRNEYYITRGSSGNMSWMTLTKVRLTSFSNKPLAARNTNTNTYKLN